MDQFDLTDDFTQSRNIRARRREVRRHDIPDPTPMDPFEEEEVNIREVETDVPIESVHKKSRRVQRDTDTRTTRQTSSMRSSKPGKTLQRAPKQHGLDRRWQIFLGLVAVILGGALMIVLISHLRNAGADQSKVLNQTIAQMSQNPETVKNAGGSFGAWLSHALFADAMGLGAFVIAFYLLVVGGCLVVARKINYWAFTFKSLLLAIAVSVISGLITYTADVDVVWGGTHGHYINKYLMDTTGYVGAIVVSLVLLAAVICAFYYPVKKGVGKATKLLPSLRRPAGIGVDPEEVRALERQAANVVPAYSVALDNDAPVYNPDNKLSEEKNADEAKGFSIDDESDIEDSETRRTSLPVLNKVSEEAKEPGFEVELAKMDTDAPAENDGNIVSEKSMPDHRLELCHYQMPTLDLLEDRPQKQTVDMMEQQKNKDRIVKTLSDYKIAINSIKATVGPTVTLYEIVPAEGVRISAIRRLEDELAMNLSAKAIRIIAPIPEKGTVGIEVPNADPQTVSMRSVLAARKFQDSTKELPIALGATIQNEVFVADLSSMPHCLVAGATGQGKSVGLNAIIASLLYKKHPSELKFVLIDPKMVEFSLYAKLENHYLAKLPDDADPIVTDTSRVLPVLSSLCVEMDNRYELLKDAGMRDIQSYNRKFEQGLLDTSRGHKYLPYLVVVIDEFADMILTGGKEVETPVTRITQKGRSAGIHMIIATQRPSTNVLTGLIKANCPARIAFRVMMWVDSRTILDCPGANQLIGRGDMLYSAGGSMERIQCAFISTPEVEKLVDFVSEQPGFAEPYILPEPMPTGSQSFSSDLGGGTIAGGGLERDPLFDEAARFTVSQANASTSSLQRRFKIGYNRAGKLTDEMEAAGIVGPASGSKPRAILVDAATLEMILSQR